MCIYIYTCKGPHGSARFCDFMSKLSTHFKRGIACLVTKRIRQQYKHMKTHGTTFWHSWKRLPTIAENCPTRLRAKLREVWRITRCLRYPSRWISALREEPALNRNMHQSGSITMGNMRSFLVIGDHSAAPWGSGILLLKVFTPRNLVIEGFRG